MDAAARIDEWCKRRTAKSCGSGAATVASSRVVSPTWRRWQETPLTGESTYKPSNHCAGKAGMSRLYLSNPCAFFATHCTRCCGRSRRPAFPAPSARWEGQRDAKPRAIHAARIRTLVPQVQLSSRTSEHRERWSGTH